MEGAERPSDAKHERVLAVVVSCLVADVPITQVMERLSDNAARYIIDRLHGMLSDMRHSLEDNTAARTVQASHILCLKIRRLLTALCERQNLLPATLFRPAIQLHPGQFITSGGFSDVYKVESGGDVVAAKMVRAKEYGKRFCREVMTGAHLHHKHVLSALGVAPVQSSAHVAILLPFCSNGTVVEWVRNTSHFPHRLRLVSEIADGLMYLHEENIVHGDLRGRNILMNDDGHIQLADYGLAGHSDASAPTSSRGGCIEWMAPELLWPEVRDDDTLAPRWPATDVYAFASVCIEIFTGKTPFRPRRTVDCVLITYILNGMRPSRPSPEECGGVHLLPDALWELMLKCWAEAREARPTAHQVLSVVQTCSFPSSTAPCPPPILTAHLQSHLTGISAPRTGSPRPRPSTPLTAAGRPCSPAFSRSSSPSAPAYRPSSPGIRRVEPRLWRPSPIVPGWRLNLAQVASDPIARPCSMPRIRALPFPIMED